MLEVGYVGSSGINLLDYNHNVNTALLASAANPINGFTHHHYRQRCFPRTLHRLRSRRPAGHGVRRHFQLQQLAGHRPQAVLARLTLQGSYTWSKSLTDLTVDSANSNNASNLMQQYGPSYFNRPQRFIVNYSWDIPFGKHMESLANWLEGGTSPA